MMVTSRYYFSQLIMFFADFELYINGIIEYSLFGLQLFTLNTIG